MAPQLEIEHLRSDLQNVVGLLNALDVIFDDTAGGAAKYADTVRDIVTSIRPFAENGYSIAHQLAENEMKERTAP